MVEGNELSEQYGKMSQRERQTELRHLYENLPIFGLDIEATTHNVLYEAVNNPDASAALPQEPGAIRDFLSLAIANRALEASVDAVKRRMELTEKQKRLGNLIISW